MAKEFPRLLIADKDNKIYDLPDIEAVGMKGGKFFRLKASDLVKLPVDSELFMLPGRSPVGYDPGSGEYVTFKSDPFSRKKDPCFAVAAFIAPGYTVSYNAAFEKKKGAGILPLFSYSAVVFYKDEFYVAGIRVDREKRQCLSGMDMRKVSDNVKSYRKIFPDNRLVRHLERCALEYGCPAAKNFFLSRHEGPLPSSPSCNAICIGCISHQPENKCVVTQPRIKFIPSAEEIAQAAVFHMGKTRDPVVSFGQGCEGEPLLVGDILEKAIRLIRKKTDKGIINLNTNASKPGMVKKLFKAGLDSMRVSVNSFREQYYGAYYKPKDYTFNDVISSIKNAGEEGGFVSINYLVMPGFTDHTDEVSALRKILDKCRIDMIQWRNLNYDHFEYFDMIGINPDRKKMIGMKALLGMVKKDFPEVLNGYFNPSRARMDRRKTKR